MNKVIASVREGLWKRSNSLITLEIVAQDERDPSLVDARLSWPIIVAR
jgi:hypothetical protein